MEEKFGISTKKYMLDEMKGKFGSKRDFIITNYKGLSSLEMEKLRKKLNKVSSKYLVVKNAIAKRAFGEMGIKDVEQFLKGEIGIDFTDDIIKSSKALLDFSKEHRNFKISSAFIDGKVETGGRVKFLATIPSREALLGLVVSRMKSPITGFHGVLQGLLRNLVYIVSEIQKKRGK